MVRGGGPQIFSHLIIIIARWRPISNSTKTILFLPLKTGFLRSYWLDWLIITFYIVIRGGYGTLLGSRDTQGGRREGRGALGNRYKVLRGGAALEGRAGTLGKGYIGIFSGIFIDISILIFFLLFK